MSEQRESDQGSRLKAEPSTVVNLADRVVLVTGGNGGIGLGLAEGCAAVGADIVIWGTNETKLAAAETRLKAMGAKVLASRVDVSDEEAVIAGMDEVMATMGRIDAAFANAGVSGSAPFLDQTTELWRRTLAVNLDGAFYTLREAARKMVEGGGGSLVGVSSVSAIHGAPRSQPYAASKAALLAIMRGLAVELAPQGIRCNSIVPGWTETELTEPSRENEKFVANTTYRTPIRRWGLPEDYRALGAFLADPTLVYHTGDEIVMDGGYTRF